MSGSLGAYPALMAGQGIQRQNSLMADPGQYLNWLNTANQLKLFPLEQQRMELGNQAIQLQMMGQQLEQNLVRQNAAIGLIQPLLMGEDGKPTKGISTQDVSRALADAVKTVPGWTAQDSAALMSTLPTGPNGQEDPVANRKWALQHWASLEMQRGHSQQALEMLGMRPGQVDTGQGIQGVGVSGPLTQSPGAITQQGGAVQTYPSRAQLMGQVGRPVTAEEAQTLGVPVGTIITETMAQRLQQQGAGNLAGPAGGGSAPASAPQPPPAPPVQQAPGASAPTQPPPAPQAQQTQGPKPVVSALAPGTSENMVASAGSVHEANVRAKNFATDMFPLNNALEDLDKAPTGKGSEAIHHFSSLLQTYSPEWLQRSLAFISPVMTPEQTTAYDLAKKYLTQGQLGAPGATRSNEGLSTAGAASPSVEITPEAAKLVLKGMIGLRRMEQAGTMAFNQSGLPPAAGDKFFANFATQADPRAYMFDKMTPQQRQQAITSIKDPAKRQAFMAQVQNAEQMGLFK